jgi:hypothetical protein
VSKGFDLKSTTRVLSSKISKPLIHQSSSQLSLQDILGLPPQIIAENEEASMFNQIEVIDLLLELPRHTPILKFSDFHAEPISNITKMIAGLGGRFPFEETEDERRMHTELVDAMVKNDESTFHSKVFSRILRSVYAITASEEFENRLDEALSRIMRQNSGAKAASTISTMVYKLLKKNTEIIEAASDGDIARVAKLISLGANVNARDRWGVSYLLCRLCYLS